MQAILDVPPDFLEHRIGGQPVRIRRGGVDVVHDPVRGRERGQVAGREQRTQRDPGEPIRELLTPEN